MSDTSAQKKPPESRVPGGRRTPTFPGAIGRIRPAVWCEGAAHRIPPRRAFVMYSKRAARILASGRALRGPQETPSSRFSQVQTQPRGSTRLIPGTGFTPPVPAAKPGLISLPVFAFLAAVSGHVTGRIGDFINGVKVVFSASSEMSASQLLRALAEARKGQRICGFFGKVRTMTCFGEGFSGREYRPWMAANWQHDTTRLPSVSMPFHSTPHPSQSARRN
jgi:hypothetical protein